jgi:osmotically-inducible protein OsmY
MDTRQRDGALTFNIIRVVKKTKSHLYHNLSVIAVADGTVYLRGTVPTYEDRRLVENLVEHVPGVARVFCNLATRESQLN